MNAGSRAARVRACSQISGALPMIFQRLSPRCIRWQSQIESKYGETVATCACTTHAARRKISDALVPPKPNEFDSATSISRLRGLMRHEIDRRSRPTDCRD